MAIINETFAEYNHNHDAKGEFASGGAQGPNPVQVWHPGQPRPKLKALKKAYHMLGHAASHLLKQRPPGHGIVQADLTNAAVRLLTSRGIVHSDVNYYYHKEPGQTRFRPN